MDEEALIISVAPKCPVQQVVADLAKPAMMIWTKVPDNPLPATSDRGMEDFSSFLAVPYALTCGPSLHTPMIACAPSCWPLAKIGLISPRVNKLVQEFAELQFLQYTENFPGLAIYVKPTKRREQKSPRDHLTLGSSR